MMKRVAIAVVVLCCIAVVAQDKPASPTTAPTLSTEQKFQLRDLQAKDAEISNAILQTQMQAQQRMQQLAEQKKGYTDQMAKLTETLCKSSDGKKYTLNYAELTCVATPEPAKPVTPEKK